MLSADATVVSVVSDVPVRIDPGNLPLVRGGEREARLHPVRDGRRNCAAVVVDVVEEQERGLSGRDRGDGRGLPRVRTHAQSPRHELVALQGGRYAARSVAGQGRDLDERGAARRRI
jgi:hypothetical protein